MHIDEKQDAVKVQIFSFVWNYWCCIPVTGWHCGVRFYEYPPQRSLWELLWFILWRWARARPRKHLTETITRKTGENLFVENSLDWTVTRGGSGNYLTRRQRQESRGNKKERTQRQVDRKGEWRWHLRFFIVESSNFTRWQWWWRRWRCHWYRKR